MSTTHALLEETLGAFDRAWANASMGGFSSESLTLDAAGMGDVGLVTAASALGSHQRAEDAPRVAMAGEIAHRSQLSLGTDGMARKAGHARPAQYLAELWKITIGEAMRLCEVGLATRSRTAIDGTPLPARYPAIAAAITDGTLGVDSAAVIVKELEAASTRCSVEARVAGETLLVSLAPGHSVADLHGLARQVRDRLDEDGAEPRDELHHKRRACRFITLADGMVRLQWDMPPEVAGLVKAGIDACVSQALRQAKDERTEARRDASTQTKTESETDTLATADACDELLAGDDERTLDQLRSDAAEQIFRHVASCAGHGGDIPSITMVIRMTKESLLTGLGIAEIDGVGETISAGTARRRWPGKRASSPQSSVGRRRFSTSGRPAGCSPRRRSWHSGNAMVGARSEDAPHRRLIRRLTTSSGGRMLKTPTWTTGSCSAGFTTTAFTMVGGRSYFSTEFRTSFHRRGWIRGELRDAEEKCCSIRPRDRGAALRQAQETRSARARRSRNEMLAITEPRARSLSLSKGDGPEERDERRPDGRDHRSLSLSKGDTVDHRRRAPSSRLAVVGLGECPSAGFYSKAAF